MSHQDLALAGADAAGGQHKLLVLDGENLTPDDAGHLHPAREPDDDHDEDEDAEVGTERLLEWLPEQHNRDQQRRQDRQGEKQVGDAHEQPVNPAEIPGQDADGRPNEHAEEHGGKADGE